MNISEQYQEVHRNSSPVRRVVDVSLAEVSGEDGLLVRLVYQGKLDTSGVSLLAFLLDKVLREDQPLQLGDLPISCPCRESFNEGISSSATINTQEMSQHHRNIELQTGGELPPRLYFVTGEYELPHLKQSTQRYQYSHLI